jgi:hypothetical protein
VGGVVKLLRLGILGLSEGNGHPYSWSAIFNGYDKQVMSECPFPVIPDYLSRQEFPRDAIPDARVTHIWTQDRELSRHVAAAALIENVVDEYEAMIGQVDAVLLARDDAENHRAMSEPLLRAGLPIYIDKPLALSVAEAKKIYSLERYAGQIFTCSALAYARELQITSGHLAEIGQLERIEAQIGKSWDKYAVHIVEPVLRMTGPQGDMTEMRVESKDGAHRVRLTWSTGLVTVFSTHGEVPVVPEIRLIGQNGSVSLTFKDTYAAFKRALEEFVAVARGQRSSVPKELVTKIVTIIEAGRSDG